MHKQSFFNEKFFAALLIASLVTVSGIQGQQKVNLVEASKFYQDLINRSTGPKAPNLGVSSGISTGALAISTVCALTGTAPAVAAAAGATSVTISAVQVAKQLIGFFGPEKLAVTRTYEQPSEELKQAYQHYMAGKIPLILIPSNWQPARPMIDDTLQRYVPLIRQALGQPVLRGKFITLSSPTLNDALVERLHSPPHEVIEANRKRINLAHFYPLFDVLELSAVISYAAPRNEKFRNDLFTVIAHIMDATLTAYTLPLEEQLQQLQEQVSKEQKDKSRLQQSFDEERTLRNKKQSELEQENQYRIQAEQESTKAQQRFIQERLKRNALQEECNQEHNQFISERIVRNNVCARFQQEENRADQLLVDLHRMEANLQQEQQAYEEERQQRCAIQAALTQTAKGRQNQRLAEAIARKDSIIAAAINQTHEIMQQKDVLEQALEQEKTERAAEKEAIQKLRTNENDLAVHEYTKVRSQLSPLRHRAENAEREAQEKDAELESKNARIAELEAALQAASHRSQSPDERAPLHELPVIHVSAAQPERAAQLETPLFDRIKSWFEEKLK